MKTRTIIIIAALVASLPAAARASFERAAYGTRSRAMGNEFVSLGDDASTLFVNAAGMVLTRGYAFYADYTEPPGGAITSSAKGCLVAQAWRGACGAGWYRLGRGDGTVENLFSGGVAWTLLEGTQGSFLSVGGSVVVARILAAAPCVPCGGRASEDRVSGDLGIMLRPLPIVSFGYAVTNAGRNGFDFSGESWPRVSRWGVSYFWEGKVVISLGQERTAGVASMHYGFGVRTALPLELLGGFCGGSVFGGVRCTVDRFRAAAAFSSSAEDGSEVIVSLELLFGPDRGEVER